MKYSIIKGGKCFLLILLVYSSYGEQFHRDRESPREIYFKPLCPSHFKGRIIPTLDLSKHQQ